LGNPLKIRLISIDTTTHNNPKYFMLRTTLPKNLATDIIGEETIQQYLEIKKSNIKSENEEEYVPLARPLPFIFFYHLTDDILLVRMKSKEPKGDNEWQISDFDKAEEMDSLIKETAKFFNKTDIITIPYGQPKSSSKNKEIYESIITKLTRLMFLEKANMSKYEDKDWHSKYLGFNKEETEMFMEFYRSVGSDKEFKNAVRGG